VDEHPRTGRNGPTTNGATFGGAGGRNLERLLDRLPPHSLEAEMALLGSMIIEPGCVDDVLEYVSSGDAFYAEAHALIFDALRDLHARSMAGDVVALAEALKGRSALDDVGQVDYLVKLAEQTPSAANAKHYARIVRDKGRLRALIEAAGQIVYDAYHAGELEDEEGRSILDTAEQRIFDVAEAATTMDQQTLGELLDEAMEMLVANHGRVLTGLSAGFDDFDELTSGLQPGELVIVAARPSMGKTALALNMAEQVAMRGARFGADGSSPDGRAAVAFFSMEMSKQSLVQRMLSSASGVDSHRMRTNILGDAEYRRLENAAKTLSTAPLYIDDTPNLTVMLLRAKARRMVKRHGVRCIFIDYLQLMTAPGSAKEGRQQEVSNISRGVKALARELNIPVVCLAQLNRGAEQREGHRPRMADLRESGSIEQDADVIALLHREDYYHVGDRQWEMENEDKIGVAELIIAKQRNGPTDTVELTWDRATTRFKNLARRAPSPRDEAPSPAGPPRGYTTHAAEPKPAGPAFGGGAPSGFAPGKNAGPVDDFRDGGGPDVEWDDDDLPI
jgi:replicative DNA helicase